MPLSSVDLRSLTLTRPSLLIHINQAHLLLLYSKIPPPASLCLLSSLYVIHQPKYCVFDFNHCTSGPVIQNSLRPQSCQPRIVANSIASSSVTKPLCALLETVPTVALTFAELCAFSSWFHFRPC